MVAPAAQRSYSIIANERELNPDQYALHNPHMEANIVKLYEELVKELGNDNFQFQITGGDRYVGADGKVYSCTDHSVIGTSGPAHLRGDAVDLRIKFNDGKLIPLEIVQPIVKKHTSFIFDPKGMPKHYPDQHYHLQFPKGYQR